METITAGYDESNNVYFVSFDPTFRKVLAVMIHLEGEWVPRKLYAGKGTGEKVRSRAVKFCKWCRNLYKKHKFKVDTVWEPVPANEREVAYYEKIEEIIEAVWDRYGRDIIVGLGSTRLHIEWPNEIKEFEKILKFAGQNQISLGITRRGSDPEAR